MKILIGPLLGLLLISFFYLLITIHQIN